MFLLLFVFLDKQEGWGVNQFMVILQQQKNLDQRVLYQLRQILMSFKSVLNHPLPRDIILQLIV